MMIEWPESLVEEIAARRVIFFLGAGMSASAATEDGICPPNWYELLEKARDRFLKDETESSLVNILLEKDKLLDAAEVVFHKIGSPERRNFFNQSLATPRFIPSDLHECVRNINPKIVITTNYDQIYETTCGATVAGQGYSVRKYTDSKLLNDIRSKDNLIIKAHGCVTDTNDLIITRSDYFRIKKENAQFYNVLNSLLMVNTVVFIGCSLNDPDIQLVLENTNVAAHSDHPHYALLPSGIHKALRSTMRSAYNIEPLEYDIRDDNDHSELLESLQNLESLVEVERPKMM